MTRSSRQSSSWSDTFWSTVRQRLFSVMSVTERFDARIIWGTTRRFTTPGRPSILAPMITVPAPTTQWPASENTRLVGSQKLGHKRLSVLLFASESDWRHICYASAHVLLGGWKGQILHFFTQEVLMLGFLVRQTLNIHWFNRFLRQCTLRRRASLTAKSAKWCSPARFSIV